MMQYFNHLVTFVSLSLFLLSWNEGSICSALWPLHTGREKDSSLHPSLPSFSYSDMFKNKGTSRPLWCKHDQVRLQVSVRARVKGLLGVDGWRHGWERAHNLARMSLAPSFTCGPFRKSWITKGGNRFSAKGRKWKPDATLAVTRHQFHSLQLYRISALQLLKLLVLILPAFNCFLLFFYDLLCEGSPRSNLLCQMPALLVTRFLWGTGFITE